MGPDLREVYVHARVGHRPKTCAQIRLLLCRKYDILAWIFLKL